MNRWIGLSILHAFGMIETYSPVGCSYLPVIGVSRVAVTDMVCVQTLLMNDSE